MPPSTAPAFASDSSSPSTRCTFTRHPQRTPACPSASITDRYASGRLTYLPTTATSTSSSQASAAAKNERRGAKSAERRSRHNRSSTISSKRCSCKPSGTS